MKQIIFNFPPLNEGTLIKRYKRFLADICLDDGQVITAHCPNTGPMRGLISDKTRVRVSRSSSQKRKLSWTWEQVAVENMYKQTVWVGINTLLANKLVRTIIENNFLISYFGEIESVKAEVAYGKERKSRIDLLLIPKSSNPDKRSIYIEVKNTTWMNHNIALFPDTVTKRGQKHLRELVDIMPENKGVLIPCITRYDAKYFLPGDEADPLYGRLFRNSMEAGVDIIPCCFRFERDHICWEGFRPVLSDKMDMSIVT